MKSHARVVVVGGGVMGVGLLYHLALEGWTDIVLVEKGELTSGSTWHAAGQCPHFNGSLNMTKVHVYGTQLYPQLEKLTGQAVSWHGCGGLRIATTDEEVNWLKQVYGLSKLANYEAHIIGPDEIKQYHPFLNTDGIKAAFLTVTDGHVAPADITNAMAAGARKLGAEIYRRTLVTDIKLLKTGEWQVVTDKGNITCEHVVNSAGSYCDVVGSWTGHNVPIANMLHHYMITEPLAALIELEKELPVVRDPYSHAYLREETNGILVGPYETATAHVCWDGKPPAWDFESELVPPELDRLTPWLEKAAERFPLFGESGLKNIISGAITHTPDGVYLSGPAHGPKNYWMHCGASIGICQGGGAGKYLAQWMVHGQAEINMREFDPRRFGNWATKDYTTEVSIADYHHMYYCYKPAEQHQVGRGLRKSAIHDKLAAAGAQFSQIFGWERARWYDKTGKGEAYSFKRSNWWDAVKAECKAVRERVGLMDLSTFAKFDVKGPDAYAFLERICANRIPAKDGGIMLGHLLNENGFIESEITVTRLAADHFYVLSAAAAQLYDMDQLCWRLKQGERVTIADVTDDFGVLVLAGPKARDVLAACTKADLTNASFRWLTGKEIEVAGVKGVRSLRVNYVGELGWELHVPMKQLPTVFDAVMKAGAPHGIQLFGTYAMNSLRMEKAYRGWGSELTNEVTLVEGDMERFVNLDKDFIGKAATQRSKQQGARIKLVYMTVEAGNNDCYGNEPIYQGDKLVGITTGGAYGHAIGKSLTFAYVDPKLARDGEAFEILMMGERHKAQIAPQPAWDPKNERLRG
ncbi:MAG TPA: FAD-dependent oxidoreductase [Hypericibacter adhaerens]|jgi:dimethylglycine dehydrogenase|uniref:Glycine cleavage system protein T n=1 Tax=Hypericibacter adhaerens TaxID=2602016 RepID=A0A5J6N454_9PROT|nr:FAD-dependent oxidoreductase [Hypericibacter adhaerens]QEX21676.1 glycine cleavage system protein T [Hypericibacter adhaerens]HWA43283.1 FAD-dependent oxidoreductase [Hypericibacter adhaerens]